MASESESLTFDTNIDSQEEYLQGLTDEQLEQLLYDTLLVTIIIVNVVLCYPNFQTFFDG